MSRSAFCLMLLGLMVASLISKPAHADGDLHKLKHIIIVMQENHSFDNYFGALAYDLASPYHNGNGPCPSGDHRCVDGLTCTAGSAGLTCSNSNPHDDETKVYAFHDPRLCVAPDLDHEWGGSHYEGNFTNPNNTLKECPNDGFVRQNEQSVNDDEMGFYTQHDIPFYYYLAENFAIDDRYFASVMGATVSNRFYLMAATSFGHLDGRETIAELLPGIPPIPVPYLPITGTIFDLLDKFNVSWVDYYSDVPQAVSFVDPSRLATQAETIEQFKSDAALGTLPQVAFVEAATGDNPFNPQPENDEHPPTDIRRGQAFVSQVLSAVRSGPNWPDSIIFVTHDEHGGFYDHVAPPAARQGGASSPDGIGPGQCADLTNQSLGQGENCTFSQASAHALCPEASPDQRFPRDCANFDQLGFRVPLIAVSPFSKPHYVSHHVGDHTSILALIEKRFFPIEEETTEEQRTFLTRRDRHADTLEDLFDFDHSPSLSTPIQAVAPPSPADDCTP